MTAMVNKFSLGYMANFDDLLAANDGYASQSEQCAGNGQARAGVCLVTCMDARLEPLEIIGLTTGDAQILRTPGGHVTPDAHAGIVLACQLLGANRVLVVMHTKCAMASGTDLDLRRRIEAHGVDASDYRFGADPNQDARLRADVAMLRADPILAAATIGGFNYDIDSRKLTQIC